MSMLENLRERCRIARSKITDNNVIDSEIVESFRSRIDNETRMCNGYNGSTLQCEDIKELQVREISAGKDKLYVAEACRDYVEKYFHYDYSYGTSGGGWNYDAHAFKVYAVSNGASLVIDFLKVDGWDHYRCGCFITDEKGNKHKRSYFDGDETYQNPDFDEAIKFMGRFPDVAKFMNKYVNVKEAGKVAERSGANQQKTLNPNLLQKRKGLGE